MNRINTFLQIKTPQLQTCVVSWMSKNLHTYSQTTFDKDSKDKDNKDQKDSNKFDINTLPFLACPLSKGPLR